jgi:hypothetical protein
MTLRSTLAVALLLIGACSVGEVPLPGGGVDGGATGGGGGSGTGTGGGTGSGTGSGTGTGGGSGTGGGNTAATNATWDANVKPKIAVCIACHSGLPPTLTKGSDLEATYKVKPGSTSKLVTYGAHTGPALDTTQKAAIVTWLDSL